MSYQQVNLTRFGGPHALEIRRVDTRPAPGPGQVRLRVLVTSAAFTDVIIRKELHPGLGTKPPFVPGYDLVGVVDAVGPGVAGLKPGDRVADLTVTGAYSEFICVPADSVVAVPGDVTDTDALAVILSGVTAYQMLHRVAGLRAGQALLIHGAGGSVGTLILELARHAELTAFGTDIAAKHDLIRRRGGIPIDAEGPRVRDGISRAVAPGVDAVFDPFGSQTMAGSLEALARGGILVGFQNRVTGRGGSVPADLARLFLWNWLPNGRRTAFYSITAMRRRHPCWFREDLATLFTLVSEGKLRPTVAEIMPLSEVRTAHERVEAGLVPGKLVLRVSDR